MRTPHWSAAVLNSAAPRWLRFALGGAAILLGLTLLVRPTFSLEVLVSVIGVGLVVSGIADLLDDRGDGLSRGVAAAWIFAGVAVLVFSGLTVRLIGIFVGVSLILHAVIGLWHIRDEPRWDDKASALLLALAGAIAGVLALAWPDVTLLVIAVVFGARLTWYGVTVGWSAMRRNHTSPVSVSRPVGALPRGGRLLGSVAVVVVAVLLAWVGAQLTNGIPSVSRFYDTPSWVPAQHGELLRTESYTSGVPSGAQGWRILYTTTRSDGRPAVASGVVITPRSGAEHPVIAWAHGTTGFSRQCAPSIDSIGLEAGAFFLLDQVLSKGWALVATDYTGLGTSGVHPYLIGPGEARSVVDAVRAARQLTAAHLGQQAVVWGHSQGGNAALWTGELQPAYDPDVSLSGVAALAPASDLIGLVRSLPHVTGGSVFASYVVGAYTGTYDDLQLSNVIRPGAQVLVQQMWRRCLAEPGVLVSVLTSLSLSKDPQIFRSDPTSGALGRRLQENTPTGHIAAPLLIGQGADDSLVLPSIQAAYVTSRCAAGQAIDYRTYPGRNHVPLVEPDSPAVAELISWTQDRFDGNPVRSTCS